ncbi:MAG: DUF4197 domain-containing protein [Bacteroidales bacterium]
MKKVVLLFFAFGLMLSACSKKDAENGLFNEVNGLKEMLQISADTSVFNGAKVDGYFKNKAIKILLPKEIQSIVDKPFVKPILGGLAEELVLKLNRAAEGAALKAKPILKKSINNLNFQDGWNIIWGNEHAATDYFKGETFSDLEQAFRPSIQSELEAVGAQQLWASFSEKYNLLPGVSKLETDLAKYTTEKALDGLFYMMAKEEAEIRQNPKAYSNDLISLIFN